MGRKADDATHMRCAINTFSGNLRTTLIGLYMNECAHMHIYLCIFLVPFLWKCMWTCCFPQQSSPPVTKALTDLACRQPRPTALLRTVVELWLYPRRGVAARPHPNPFFTSWPLFSSFLLPLGFISNLKCSVGYTHRALMCTLACIETAQNKRPGRS